MWPKRRKEMYTGYKIPLEARKGKLIKETGKEFGNFLNFPFLPKNINLERKK